MGSKILTCIAALFILLCGAGRASAQQCPASTSAGADSTSSVRVLRGQLIYHDDIRQWFELKLDRPACGETSIQLTRSEGSWEPLQKLRGCRVESRGKIDFSPTGYYSLDLYQDTRSVKSVGACTIRPPFADYSGVRPDRHVRSYTVDMHVDYRPGDHPVIFHVRSGHRELRPWQAYAGYWLTGGFVLYGLCGRGFVVDRVFGTPAARPLHFGDPRGSGDMAEFDPETAAQSGKTDLHLGYTCIRAN